MRMIIAYQAISVLNWGCKFLGARLLGMRSAKILNIYTFFHYAAAIGAMAVLLLASGTALAEIDIHKTKSLSEEDVKAFIEETVDITSGKRKDISDFDLEDYLETHLDEESYFKSTMRYIMPGHPPQESELKLNKEDYISSIKGGSQALSEHKTKVRVKDIKISKSKRSATVTTETREKGEMPIEGQMVPINGVSSCKQIIRLSDDDVIQMYNALCETEIEFDSF